MDRMFKVSVGMKVFYSVIGIGMVGFAIFLLWEIPENSGGIIILPILILLCGIFVIVTQQKRKIVVGNESITKITLFKTSSMLFSEIRGVRVGDKAISIESNLTPSTKITIGNYIDYSDSEELTKYLLTTFVDLNDVEYKAELNQILNDNTLGLTEDDRKARLKKAQYIAWSYNGGGIICFVIGLFGHTINSVVLLLIYPFLAIPLILTSKKLIRFIPKSKSPYYSVFIGTMIPCMFLLISSTDQYEILKFSGLLLPFVAVTGVFGLIFYFTDNGNDIVSGKARLIPIIMISLLYGFGSVRSINCAFDNSEEQVYQARVLDHSISHGKSTTYYLTLTPWGPQVNTVQVSVSRYRYYHADIGSTVSIHLKKGVLNAPWFTISD